jgi:hypothetical protein
MLSCVDYRYKAGWEDRCVVLSFDGGPMWFSGMIQMLAQLETGRGN